MSEERAVADLLAAGLDDWVSLDDVIWATGGETDSPGGREAVLETLNRLLSDDLMVPGDLMSPGFADWPGPRELWPQRAARELERFKWQPQGASFWLRLTDVGRREAEAGRTGT